MSGLFQEIKRSIGSKGITFVEDEDSEKRRWIKQGWRRKSQIFFQTSYSNREKLTFNLELQLDLETRTGSRSVARFRRL